MEEVEPPSELFRTTKWKHRQDKRRSVQRKTKLVMRHLERAKSKLRASERRHKTSMQLIDFEVFDGMPEDNETDDFGQAWSS